MPLLKFIDRETIHREFTHVGWLLACPVYVDLSNPEMPSLTERNGVPHIWLEINTYAVQFANMLGGWIVGPNFHLFNFPLVVRPLE